MDAVGRRERHSLRCALAVVAVAGARYDVAGYRRRYRRSGSGVYVEVRDRSGIRTSRSASAPGSHSNSVTLDLGLSNRILLTAEMLPEPRLTEPSQTTPE